MQLPKQYDAPKVVSIVCRQALKLLADGHHSRRLARGRWAADWLIQPLFLGSRGSGLPVAVKESPAKRGPALPRGVGLRRKAQRRVLRAGRLLAAYPVQRYLLPEGDVPQLFIYGVRRARSFYVRQRFVYPFKNVRWRRCGAVRNQCPFQFICKFLT